MSNQAEFFRAQAQAMEAQAAASALTNVRERCLRSAEAWTHMAERAERHEQSRERTERMKAEAAAAAMPAMAAE
jgi:hypothetical protein